MAMRWRREDRQGESPGVDGAGYLGSRKLPFSTPHRRVTPKQCYWANRRKAALKTLVCSNNDCETQVRDGKYPQAEIW